VLRLTERAARTAGNVRANRSRGIYLTPAYVSQITPFGIGDNLPNYTRWLHVSEMYRQLIFERINIPPFVGPVVIDPRAAAVTYFYAIGRMLSLHDETQGLDIALECGL
jgi:hypothetical protein